MEDQSLSGMIKSRAVETVKCLTDEEVDDGKDIATLYFFFSRLSLAIP